MVLLLNILLPVTACTLWFICYLMSKGKPAWTQVRNILITFFAVHLLIALHGLIQPSYLPKGEAPPLTLKVEPSKEVQVKDVLSKPDVKEPSELLTVTEEVKEINSEGKD